MDYSEQALKQHREWHGKIRVNTPCPMNSREDLSVAYTPGVAAPCLEIAKDVEKSYEYTKEDNICNQKYYSKKYCIFSRLDIGFNLL